MPTVTSPFAVRRCAGAPLVGHVALGAGIAGLVQRRAEDGALSYTATVLGGAATAVHGGNAAGLVCAALDGGGRQLVVPVLEAARSVAEATALLETSAAAAPGSTASVLLADAAGAVVATLSGEGLAQERPPAAPATGLPELLAALRDAEPDPDESAAPVAGMAALLVPGEAPRLHFALGPPSCAVFVRHWPGLELTPEEAAGPEGAPLARVAVAVAQLSSSDAELRAAARARLDAVEAEALREGEDAERMAALMDAGTDDRGAAVRRLVAQVHAAELARQALAELAVPAPPL